MICYGINRNRSVYVYYKKTTNSFIPFAKHKEGCDKCACHSQMFLSSPTISPAERP